MGSLSWAFKISDRMSGPASRISKDVAKVERSLHGANRAAMTFGAAQMAAMNRTPLAYQRSARAVGGFGRALQLVGRIGGPRAVDATMTLSRSLVSVDDALGRVGTSLGGVASAGAMGFVGALAAVTAALAAVTAGLAYFGAKATAAFSKAAVVAYDFRERTLIGMEVMLKSGTKATELYGRALKFAFNTPLDTATVVSGFQKLLARGFKTSELERVMTAVSDLNTVMGGTAADAQGIMLAFGQIKAKPILSMEELNQQLSERGLNVGEVMKTIGKMTDMTVTEVDKALRSGKIKSDIGMEAILRTIEEQAGGASEKMMPTLSGMWNQLAGSSVLFWNAVFENTEGGMSQFMNKLKSGMKALVGVFLTDEGKLTNTGDRVVGIVNRIGKAWTDLLGDVDQKSMGESFNKVLTIVERIMPALEGLGAGFKEGLLSGLGPLLESFDKIDGKATDVEKTAAAFKTLGKAIGWVLGASTTATVQLAGFVGTLVGFTRSLYAGGSAAVSFVVSLTAGFMQINAFVLSLPSQMFSAGIDLVMGLAGGIRAGASAAVSAAIEMASSVVGAARNALDMHSPSRVFAELGQLTSAGFAEGIDASSPRAQDAMVDMVRAPTPRQLPAAGQAASGAGGERPAGLRIDHLELTVTTGSGDAQGVKRSILEAFEEVALEFGAATA